jgi:predicted acetyltransferase
VLEPFLTHLATHAAEWWIAEDSSDGSTIGYARSIERGGLVELSEFFIRPDRQSAGVGRRLIERVFPQERGEVRAIIATTDTRGLHRYYAAGTLARFAMVSLAGSPAPTRSDVDMEVVSATVDQVEELAALEKAVFGYPRHTDYAWLFEQREAYLYRRAGRAVGFAFFSKTGQGPIAALEPADLRPMLLHLEARALFESTLRRRRCGRGPNTIPIALPEPRRLARARRGSGPCTPRNTYTEHGARRLRRRTCPRLAPDAGAAPLGLADT